MGNLTLEFITPCLMVINEEYWIHYVLRDLLKVFGRAIMVDTGSTDATKSIALDTARDVGAELQLIERVCNNPVEIGQLRNYMREICPTYWMFLVDGDEIYRESQLRGMLTQEVKPDILVCMGTLYNVEDVDGRVMNRTNDRSNRDILFNPTITWTRLDYPFESYGLQEDFMSNVQYLDVSAYHLRHTIRSSQDDITYFRREKIGYFPYPGPFDELPDNWLGDIRHDLPNPYLQLSTI